MLLKAKRTRRPRDAQRAKLYRAEREVFSYGFEEPEPIERVQMRIEAIFESAYVKRTHPKFMPKMVKISAAGRTWARGGPFSITLPPFARRLSNWWIVLHEVAHAICGWEYPSFTIQAHGREFARVYLGLAEAFLSRDDRKKLEESFKKHGVKWREKRVLSPERLAQLRERGRLLAATRGQR